MTNKNLALQQPVAVTTAHFKRSASPALGHVLHRIVTDLQSPEQDKRDAARADLTKLVQTGRLNLAQRIGDAVLYIGDVERRQLSSELPVLRTAIGSLAGVTDEKKTDAVKQIDDRIRLFRLSDESPAQMAASIPSGPLQSPR